MSTEPNQTPAPGERKRDESGAARERLEREQWLLRRTLLRESRRAHFWRAALVGVLAGMGAVLFQWALEAAEHLRTLLVWTFQQVGVFGVVTTIAFSAALAGAAAWLTSRYAPDAGGSGIPHTKAVLMGLRRMRWLPTLVVKFVGGFLAIGAGLSLGREGPTVHMGACIGSGLAERLRVPKRSRKTMIASGAGAGLAAAFNAPLAGFLFIIEELARELTPVTYGTALIAAVTADAITRLFIGQRTSFRITEYPAPPLELLPLIALLGLVAGLLGVAFNRSLLGTARLMSRWKWQKALVVGAVAGVALIYVPEITGGGHKTAEVVLSGSYTNANALSLIALLLAGKFVLTLISYGSGVPGGIFAPMLVIGAFLGLGFGEVSKMVFPNAGINSAAFAVLGMAALFAGSVRVPITGIVLILEMTNNFDQLYAVIVASLAAYLVGEAFRDQPIYEAILERDLQKADPLSTDASDPILLELFVEPGSFLDERQVEEIELPAGSAIVSVLRGRNEFVPPAKFHIKARDVIVFLLETNDPRLVHAVSRMVRR